MKVHFDGVNPGSMSGPNTFGVRLAKKLFESGHQVCFDREDADVSLVFIEKTGKPLAKRVVQRLDGIWFKPSEFEIKNVGIIDLYHQADAIVWQSEFDKQMTTKWFGAPRFAKSSAIIRNGISINPLKKLTLTSLQKFRSEYKRMYVCSANWHPQKRLRDNIELYKKLRKNEPSSCLIILGSNPDYIVADPHIFYAGPQPPEVYLEVYAACDWMIHLAWADHCPNVVVEALSQGTPVVCSSIGGTKELIGEYGVIVKDDNYSFELFDYDNPPRANIASIEHLPMRTQLSYEGIAESIDIDWTCKQYIKLFEEVLS